MSECALPHSCTDHVKGGAVFRDVSALVKRVVPAFILIDLSQTKHISGMAFVVLSNLAHRVAASGGRLAICCLDPTLRVGADLIGLGSGLDVYDDEASALASF